MNMPNKRKIYELKSQINWHPVQRLYILFCLDAVKLET